MKKTKEVVLKERDDQRRLAETIQKRKIQLFGHNNNLRNTFEGNILGTKERKDLEGNWYDTDNPNYQEMKQTEERRMAAATMHTAFRW